tara:strand:- start:7446 stop:7820 length:375 start_codon:yes stop_codon:yes gene_type:complete
MCRERGDAKAVGSIGYTEPSRTVWIFEHSEAATESTTTKGQFLAAMEAELHNAPEHIKLIKRGAGVAGSLRTALNLSAATTGDGTASIGPWSERVGKDVFRYSIGVSGSSMAAARTNRKAHDLS